VTIRGISSTIICATLVAWGGSAMAEAADPLEQGRALVRSFEYDEALGVFQSVVDDPSAPVPSRLEALARIGAVHVRQQDEAAARVAFERLCRLDPGHELVERDFAPAVRGLYGAVQEELGDQEAALMDVAAEESAPGQATITVTPGPWSAGAVAVTARVRGEGEGAYRTAELERTGGVFELSVPMPSEGLGVEYVVEARAPSGHVVAAAGSEVSPLRIAPSSPAEPVEPQAAEGRPWYGTWWFWTIVGAVVAGGTATAVALTVPAGPEEGSLGFARLE